MKNQIRKRGFSLAEVLVSLCLVTIAMVGLAPLFTVAIQNNKRSSELSNASFLSQQMIEHLRTLTQAELGNMPLTDQLIDVNQDGTMDFRRITQVQAAGTSFEVLVLIFPPIPAPNPPAVMGVDTAELVAHPDNPGYKIKAQIHTIVGR